MCLIKQRHVLAAADLRVDKHCIRRKPGYNPKRVRRNYLPPHSPPQLIPATEVLIG